MLAMFDASALCWVDRKSRDLARTAMVSLKSLSVGTLFFPPWKIGVANHFHKIKQNLYQFPDCGLRIVDYGLGILTAWAEVFEFGIGDGEF
jgi:hypothetical protein